MASSAEAPAISLIVIFFCYSAPEKKLSFQLPTVTVDTTEDKQTFETDQDEERQLEGGEGVVMTSSRCWNPRYLCFLYSFYRATSSLGSL